MNDRPLSDEDLERNEDPEAVAGAVSGATGASVGAGLGMVALGPLGAVIGALAGAAGGWWAGKEVQDALMDADRAEDHFRSAHERADLDRPFDDVRHGYRLGYLAGLNPRYRDADFDEADKALRAAWVKAHHEQDDSVSWDDVRGSARRGFDIARKDQGSATSRDR
jgi:hypothetical protein